MEELTTRLQLIYEWHKDGINSQAISLTIITRLTLTVVKNEWTWQWCTQCLWCQKKVTSSKYSQRLWTTRTKSKDWKECSMTKAKKSRLVSRSQTTIISKLYLKKADPRSYIFHVMATMTLIYRCTTLLLKTEEVKVCLISSLPKSYRSWLEVQKRLELILSLCQPATLSSLGRF